MTYVSVAHIAEWTWGVPTRSHSRLYTLFMLCRSMDICQLSRCLSFLSSYWRLRSFQLS